MKRNREIQTALSVIVHELGSQRAAAKALDVSEVHISCLLRGEEDRGVSYELARQISRIADAFGCTAIVDAHRAPTPQAPRTNGRIDDEVMEHALRLGNVVRLWGGDMPDLYTALRETMRGIRTWEMLRAELNEAIHERARRCA